MDEVEKILYALGYCNSDPLKYEQFKGYVAEAEEYMTEAGVPANRLHTQRAYAIKSLWADARDKNQLDDVVKKDGMVVNLIAQLKR